MISSSNIISLIQKIIKVLIDVVRALVMSVNRAARRAAFSRHGLFESKFAVETCSLHLHLLTTTGAGKSGLVRA